MRALKTPSFPKNISLLTIRAVSDAARAMAQDKGWEQDKTLARVWSGVELAEGGAVGETGLSGILRVRSRTGRFHHHVALRGAGPTCTCEDHRHRGIVCAHIWAVDLILAQHLLEHAGMV